MAENLTVVDAKGRSITYKPMTVLDQARILKVIGRENPMDAQNGPYVTIAMLACSVKDIDGAPQPAPTSPKDIEAAIARLGDEGFAALQVEAEKRRAEMEEAASVAAQEAQKSLIKKSRQTANSATPAG